MVTAVIALFDFGSWLQLHLPSLIWGCGYSCNCPLRLFGVVVTAAIAIFDYLGWVVVTAGIALFDYFGSWLQLQLPSMIIWARGYSYNCPLLLFGVVVTAAVLKIFS